MQKTNFFYEKLGKTRRFSTIIAHANLSRLSSELEENGSKSENNIHLEVGTIQQSLIQPSYNSSNNPINLLSDTEYSWSG